MRNKTFIFALTALVMCCAFPPASDGRESFQLQINDVSGLNEPWPLIGGLPFAEGVLHDASRIRIVDGQGHEVPAQIDVAATWQDGSIRWALAGLTASPRASFRVEFGEGVVRSEPEVPLALDDDGQGRVTVDTGGAVYAFLPDRLLPESGRMGGEAFLANAGDGAYLIDNQGRLSRVAGERAEVETEIVRHGPTRAVVRREGWYVTDDGERVARAKAWFYFAAGVPYLRVTHTLVFTEDTNALRVRDYGLEFRTPGAARQVVFPYREADEAERKEYFSTHPSRGWRGLPDAQQQAFINMFSGEKEREEHLFRAEPDGDTVYMLQDVYPHFHERDFRAVIARSDGRPDGVGTRSGSFWMDAFETSMDVAGDWGDGSYGDHGLTVVVPWMAQQFPKEIGFGPDGAYAALWSGRSGRELDFRPLTLIAEHWKSWVTNEGPGGASMTMRVGGLDRLLGMESNARGAARTHDIWLLPRHGAFNDDTVGVRAQAASNPPLLQADPEWVCATKAIGWQIYPRDTERFPREEEVLSSDVWNGLMGRYAQLRRTGFISWGMQPFIRHGRSPFYRLAMSSDYDLRRNVWGIYARSGERSHWEFGSRLNRYLGDWELCHWAEGEEHKGLTPVRFGWRGHPPIHWGDYRALFGHAGSPINWLLEHYFTGDEYVLDLARMNAEVIHAHWDGETLWPHGRNSINCLLAVHAMNWDEELGARIRDVVHGLIDLDSPNGFCDKPKWGALYKTRSLMTMAYNYYRVTGDEKARRAFLKAADYKYRFNQVSGSAFGVQASSLLFAVAWDWTGESRYRRVVNEILENFRQGTDQITIHSQVNPVFGMPAALAVVADLDPDAKLQPFPVLEYTQDEEETVEITFSKETDQPVVMGLYLRLAEQEHEDASPEVAVEHGGSGVEIELEVEKAFRTQLEGRRDMRGRHVKLTVPAGFPQGDYILRLPNAQKIVVLDSTAKDTQKR